jgi:hypothetical protein
MRAAHPRGREGAAEGRKDGMRKAGTAAFTASTDMGGTGAGMTGVRGGGARSGRGRRAEGGGRSPTPDARSPRWYHALVTRASGCEELGMSRRSVAPKMEDGLGGGSAASVDVRRAYDRVEDVVEALGTRERGGSPGQEGETARR